MYTVNLYTSTVNTQNYKRNYKGVQIWDKKINEFPEVVHAKYAYTYMLFHALHGSWTICHTYWYHSDPTTAVIHYLHMFITINITTLSDVLNNLHICLTCTLTTIVHDGTLMVV